MMHPLKFIFLFSILCITLSTASDVKQTKDTDRELTSQAASKSSEKVPSGDVNTAEFPFESAHKIKESVEFQTSHKISTDALKHRGELHQSMRSKEKPELSDQLGELIAADIKNNIETKRLSEYEKYVIEPLTTEKPVLTTQTVAQSINEGLIDDFSILEEAGSENKQTSRIQIKKGPNGQDYEYEYVYYYYDDDENKNSEDDDVIVSSRKGPSTTTKAPAGKSRYSQIERGSSTSATVERGNDIQSRGKARSQALPAPVVEEIVEERLPQVTRFPQRAKTGDAPEAGKKINVKRPSLELVDSHSFVTDEKDKISKGPRIIETELSKSELLETASKSSVEYSSSTTESLNSSEEETTPLMEKVAIDLYAIIANENAKEDDKKGRSDEDETTEAIDDEDESATDASTDSDCENCDVTSAVPVTSSTTPSTTTTSTTTTTTTEAPTTLAPTTTTEAPKRGGLTAGRNRFRFQSKAPTSTEAAELTTEAPKGKNRFSRPGSSFGSRSSPAARTTKASSSNAPEEVKETAEKSEAPVQSTSKLAGRRNRFNLRGQSTSAAGTTSSSSSSAAGSSSSSDDVETSTVSRLVKPRPQFSLRGRKTNAPSTTEAAAAETNDVNEENVEAKEEKVVEKSSSVVARPTSRLNLSRPSNRLLPGQKARTSPLASRKANEENEANKSANENESDSETTTQNNLNKLKSRPRIQIESKVKKTTVQPAVNRKVNPLISKRKFGVTSTTETTVEDEKSVDTESDNSTKDGAKDDSETNVESKEEDTTQAAVEVTSEQPRGLGLLNRRKIVNRRPGTI